MEIRVEMIKRWFVIFVFVGLFDPINARAPGGSGQIQPELRVAIHQVCKASYKTGDQYYEELLTGQERQETLLPGRDGFEGSRKAHS